MPSIPTIYSKVTEERWAEPNKTEKQILGLCLAHAENYIKGLDDPKPIEVAPNDTKNINLKLIAQELHDRQIAVVHFQGKDIRQPDDLSKGLQLWVAPEHLKETYELELDKQLRKHSH